MAYTNVWDVTMPPSTQAANQGAIDFQQTKLDIMQRVASFGAGVLANQPTPEATSATANWTGVMYWATDTKQVFMWTGTAWTDISTSIPTIGAAVQRYSNTTPNTVLDSGIGAVGMSVTLPINALVVGSVFQVFGTVYIPSFSTTPPSTTPMSSIGVGIGGTIMVNYPLNNLSPGIFTDDQYLNFVCNGICTGSSSQQGDGYAALGIQLSATSGQTFAKPYEASNAISSTMSVFMQIGSEENTGNTVIFQNLGVLVFS